MVKCKNKLLLCTFQENCFPQEKTNFIFNSEDSEQTENKIFLDTSHKSLSRVWLHPQLATGIVFFKIGRIIILKCANDESGLKTFVQ